MTVMSCLFQQNLKSHWANWSLAHITKLYHTGVGLPNFPHPIHLPNPFPTTPSSTYGNRDQDFYTTITYDELEHLESLQTKQQQRRPHQDHIADAGYSSTEYQAMVHTPICIKEALRIPDARAALEKEWKKLEDLGAWNYNTVKPRAEVEDRAYREGKTIHFGGAMDLCHIKHS